jgi:quinol monooxygenase YgiN
VSDVFELRQYTLHPGKREALIELFERAFIEPQKAAGMRVLGQFRDLDDPDRFVWFRSFPDMERRKEALTSFYGGPVWSAHRDEANATMIDSDNVLLLRLADPRFPFPSRLDSPVLALTIYEDDGSIADVSMPLLRTEHAENTYPALPVRAGENVIVSFGSRSLPLAVQQQLRLESTPKSQLRFT